MIICSSKIDECPEIPERIQHDEILEKRSND